MVDATRFAAACVYELAHSSHVPLIAVAIGFEQLECAIKMLGAGAVLGVIAILVDEEDAAHIVETFVSNVASEDVGTLLDGIVASAAARLNCGTMRVEQGAPS